VYISWAG